MLLSAPEAHIYFMAGSVPCGPAWGNSKASTGTITCVQIDEPMGTVLFRATTKGKTCILLEHGNFM